MKFGQLIKYRMRNSFKNHADIEIGNLVTDLFFVELYFVIMSHTRFRVNPHSVFASMSRNSLLKTGAISAV